MHLIGAVTINLYLRWVLAQRRNVTGICVLYKAYFGEPAWKIIGDRLQSSYYLSRLDHVRKIRNRRQRKDIGKYSFVNKTIQLWNKLTMNDLGTFPSKPRNFRKQVK